MIISSGSMTVFETSAKTLFNNAFLNTTTFYRDVATVVPSTTLKEQYAWLGQLPGMREWLSDRIIQNLATSTYSIQNRDWESTIEVGRNELEDDLYGVYNPLFSEMGRAAAMQPDILMAELLAAGFAGLCYDGQYFFDTDHPVGTEGGDYPVRNVANTDGGSGSAWFLLDTSRAIRPFIFQDRRSPVFTALNRPDDDNVFMRKTFRYGVDSRMNVGYGLWQLAWGSKQTLDSAHYKAARTAMMTMTGDNGRLLAARQTG